MTRETKIGLLVGLAFIIVIGILLSDHLTSSTEPPPATLANAGSSVLQTVNTPGSATTAPPVTEVTAPQVSPQQQVPTQGDLSPKPTPVQIVQVGAPHPPQQPPITVQSQQPAGANATPPQQPQSEPAASPLVQENPSETPPVITQVPANVNASLAQTAQRSGEGLVALDASGRPVPVGSSGASASWTQALTGAREHRAEPGDSVSRMAARLMGANTRSNRDAIVRANPSLQANPNKVIVGQVYVIPTTGELPQQPVSVAPVDSSAPAPSEPVASATEYYYTVREGDSLWKIASEQLGKPAAVAAIKELNQDALRGGDTVFVGMKLKLPGKPIAQATN